MKTNLLIAQLPQAVTGLRIGAQEASVAGIRIVDQQY